MTLSFLNVCKGCNKTTTACSTPGCGRRRLRSECEECRSQSSVMWPPSSDTCVNCDDFYCYSCSTYGHGKCGFCSHCTIVKFCSVPLPKVSSTGCVLCGRDPIFHESDPVTCQECRDFVCGLCVMDSGKCAVCGAALCYKCGDVFDCLTCGETLHCCSKCMTDPPYGRICWEHLHRKSF